MRVRHSTSVPGLMALWWLTGSGQSGNLGSPQQSPSGWARSGANRLRGRAGFQRPPSGGVDGEFKGHEAQVSRSPISQERDNQPAKPYGALANGTQGKQPQKLPRNAARYQLSITVESGADKDRRREYKRCSRCCQPDPY